MKKRVLMTMTMAAMISMFAATPVFAEENRQGWHHVEKGWFYNYDENGWGRYNDGWHWIDGNRDGIAECYYFGADEFILLDTVTPDGHTVNKDGAWVENGIVQIKTVEIPLTVEQASEQRTANIAAREEHYDEYGVNVELMDMLDNTIEENAAKYGEARLVMAELDIIYENGFEVFYSFKDDIATSVIEENDNYARIFKYFDPSIETTTELSAYLQDKGFSVTEYRNSCTIKVGNDYTIFWGLYTNYVEKGRTFTPKIKVYKKW